MTQTRTYISIHAPREGGDHGLVHKLRLFPISIHAPREGGDPAMAITEAMEQAFQSTPPARGATVQHSSNADGRPISIHAPREGGDLLSSAVVAAVNCISIHAPREGGDGFS